MPDQSSASTEHAILQEITAPLATLPDDPVPRVADVDFPVALRGYDRFAVDAYIKKTSQLVAELQATRSPEAAIRRALERVGEQISGILQRAHEAAEQITSQSRREAEDRLELARREAASIVEAAEQRVRELDNDTDRIWVERHRIVADTRGLAQELLALAESASEQFAAEEEDSTEEEMPAAPDAAEFEGGSDAGFEDGSDAGFEDGAGGGFEGGSDVGFEGRSDVGVESGGGGGFEGGSDVGFEGRSDVGFEGGDVDDDVEATAVMPQVDAPAPDEEPPPGRAPGERP